MKEHIGILKRALKIQEHRVYQHITGASQKEKNLEKALAKTLRQQMDPEITARPMQAESALNYLRFMTQQEEKKQVLRESLDQTQKELEEKVKELKQLQTQAEALEKKQAAYIKRDQNRDEEEQEQSVNEWKGQNDHQ